MAAHGGAVVEIREGRRQVAGRAGQRATNRRITADTPMAITGPAAGHDAAARPPPTRPARTVLGMLNNCAGGVTPWGTWLTAEENFHGYFMRRAAGRPSRGRQLQALRRARRHLRLGQASTTASTSPRSRTSPTASAGSSRSTRTTRPRRRRSAPRSAASSTRAADERSSTATAASSFYIGDDERFDYVYKFVTAGRFDPRRTAPPTRDLLDEGTLYVAASIADGTVEWLPLVHGQGPLTAENGFASQADVLIETRRAADLLGATPMDRPEDVEPNPRDRHASTSC